MGRFVSHLCPLGLPAPVRQFHNSTILSFLSLVPAVVYAGVCRIGGHKMRLMNRVRARQRALTYESDKNISAGYGDN